MNTKRRHTHVWDDDAICIHCGLDGADAHHQMQIVRFEVGEDEYKSRRQGGDFDNYIYCNKRVE